MEERPSLNDACPEAKGSNPTTALTQLWARNPFRGNFNHWQVSRKETGHISTIHVTDKLMFPSVFAKFQFHM